MPEAYDLHDGRFLQEKLAVSAADALNVFIGPVPAGKVWTILAGRLLPSVSELRTFWWSISTPAISVYPVTQPTSRTLNTIIGAPLVTEGMELRIYQGHYIAGYRDVATAGSTIQIGILFIETDIPYFSYVEPQRKLVAKRGTRVIQAVVSGTGSAFRGGGSEGGGGGRGGGPEPI